MRLYLCADGSYAGTQADARAKGPGWKQVEVPTDKAGLISYLNATSLSPALRVDSFPNGLTAPPPTLDDPRPDPVRQSLQLDEDFDALPLARQLHFAAVAMENARDNIKELA